MVLHKALEYPPVDEINVKAISPPVALSLGEQQALIRFQQRIPYLTKERSEEHAQLTSPLIDTDKEATPQLLGLSNWIMGSRK